MKQTPLPRRSPRLEPTRRAPASWTVVALHRFGALRTGRRLPLKMVVRGEVAPVARRAIGTTGFLQALNSTRARARTRPLPAVASRPAEPRPRAPWAQLGLPLAPSPSV